MPCKLFNSKIASFSTGFKTNSHRITQIILMVYCTTIHLCENMLFSVGAIGIENLAEKKTIIFMPIDLMFSEIVDINCFAPQIKNIYFIEIKLRFN